MTTEERFARIEHLTAGLAEERRKDREEYRQLWRETQRELHALTLKVADTNDAITRFAEETRASIAETNASIESLAQETRAADQALSDRISSLVSGMAEFIRQQQPKQA